MMSVQFSKAAVIEKNRIAIQACNQSIQRLDGMIGLTPQEELENVTQRNRASNERTQLRTVNNHLRTAGTVVQPMADDVARELNDLGNIIDEKIKNDLIINATIDFISTTLDNVKELRTITASHLG